MKRVGEGYRERRGSEGSAGEANIRVKPKSRRDLMLMIIKRMDMDKLRLRGIINKSRITLSHYY